MGQGDDYFCKCGDVFYSLKDLEDHVQNPSSKTEYSPSSYSTRHYGSKWELNRLLTKISDNFKCVDCGMSEQEHKNRDDLFGGGLHVHHKVPTKEFGNSDEAHALWNLITLCDNCHKERENSSLTFK